MANELRVRANFTGGLVDDNPLTSSAVSLSSNALQSLQVIDATKHMVIVLDPDGFGGTPEIAYLTGHTVAASTATILRAQEGTTARAHLQDTPWVHSATARDFSTHRFVTSAAASDYTVGTSWAVLDGTNLAITLAAQVGDSIELGCRATILSATNSAVYLDFEVAGARFGDTTNGCFVSHATPSTGQWTGTATTFRTVISGDLSGGLATFKPWAKVSSAMTIESTTPPVMFWAKNLGWMNQ